MRAFENFHLRFCFLSSRWATCGWGCRDFIETSDGNVALNEIALTCWSYELRTSQFIRGQFIKMTGGIPTINKRWHKWWNTKRCRVTSKAFMLHACIFSWHNWAISVTLMHHIYSLFITGRTSSDWLRIFLWQLFSQLLFPTFWEFHIFFLEFFSTSIRPKKEEIFIQWLLVQACEVVGSNNAKTVQSDTLRQKKQIYVSWKEIKNELLQMWLESLAEPQ